MIAEKLKESVGNTLIELEKVGRGAVTEDEFIENVIDIKRIQSLRDGKWETLCYQIVTATGGPNVEIDGCNEEIVGKWGKEEHREKFTNLAKEGYTRIAELLDEVV